MDFIPKDIQRYAELHTTPESDLLRRINRDTHAEVLSPRMLSGHLQGRLLALFSNMLRPKRILEVGTYTGYSALCLAEGLAPGGKLITIDRNEELETRVRRYFEASPWAAQIDYRIGDAKQIIPQLSDDIDLVFIDADKSGYAQYYNLIIGKVRTGGIIIADNVLWSGKVVSDKPDKDTQGMMAFNDMIHADDRVEQVLLPVRDGLLVMQKRA